MSTQLVTYNATDKPSFGIVRDGVQGNYDIALKMIDVIRNSVTADKGLEDFVKGAGANHLFGEKGYTSYSPIEDTLERVYEFVKNNVRYASDIAGKVESIKSARQTLSDGYGDCDDQTILTATILAILGFEPKVVLAGYGNNANFQHVYTTVNVKGKRYVLDTILENGKLNDEVPTSKKYEIGVFDYLPALDGFQGLFFQLKSAARNLKRDTYSALPTILGALPTGFGYIANTVLHTGVNALSDNDLYSKSASEIGSEINIELDGIIQQLYNKSIALDYAKVLARQAGMNLAAVEPNQPNYRIVYDSIKRKIDFINNFEKVANSQQISTLYLDGKLMLLIGVTLVSVGIFNHLHLKRKRN